MLNWKVLKRKLVLLRVMLAGGGYRRAEYLKKIHFFRRQGEGCYLIPYNYGTEPYLLSFGDNVFVASDVHFVNHDVVAQMLRRMDPNRSYTNRVGTIEVGSNVFIGYGATILYDVHIGDRVIVAAGALVNRDLPSGGVYGGVPAVRIGSFDEYMERLHRYSKEVPWSDSESGSIRKQKQIQWLYPECEK